jgi:hypothetical protein
MTVFQQVLWMFVNIRVLGKQPRLPLPRESLIQYAVAGTAVQPHLHESWNCTPPGSRRYRLADRRPARADRSRRTSAAPVAGLA